MSLTPYYEADDVSIYHADVFDVIEEVARFDALITDPPYSSGGLFRGDRKQSSLSKYVSSGALGRVEFSGDSRDQRGFAAWVMLWSGAARMSTPPGAPCLVFTDWRQLPTVTDAIQGGGWIWDGIGVWNKPNGRVQRQRFALDNEYIVLGRNGPKAGVLPAAEAAYYPRGVFTLAPRHSGKRQHIAEKPLSVMEWLVPFCPKGGTVLDPFMGSGTTLVAARDQGRKAIGADIDEHWCEVAAERVAQATLMEAR